MTTQALTPAAATEPAAQASAADGALSPLLSLPNEIWLKRILKDLPFPALGTLANTVSQGHRDRSVQLYLPEQQPALEQPQNRSAFDSEIIMQANVELGHIPREELSALFDRAARCEKWELIRSMLKKDVQFLTAVQTGQAFYIAVRLEDVGLMQKLLHVHLRNDLEGAARECFARTFQKKPELAQVILQAHYFANLSNALADLARHGHREGVRIVLDSGAEFSAAQVGFAFTEALAYHHSECAEVIMQKRKDIPVHNAEWALVFAVNANNPRPELLKSIIHALPFSRDQLNQINIHAGATGSTVCAAIVQEELDGRQCAIS